MTNMNEIETQDFQAHGYSYAIIAVPDPNIYSNGGRQMEDITDTNPEDLLDEYIERYSEAWRRLSDM